VVARPGRAQFPRRRSRFRTLVASVSVARETWPFHRVIRWH
jgi:hypothetical protein